MEKRCIADECKNELFTITQYKENDTYLFTLKVFQSPNDTIWMSKDELISLRESITKLLYRDVR